jgi:hypothetical protein
MVDGALWIWSENTLAWEYSGPIALGGGGGSGIPAFRVDERGHLMMDVADGSIMAERFRVNQESGRLEYVVRLEA